MTPQTLSFRGWRYPAQTLRGGILFLMSVEGGGEPLTRQDTEAFAGAGGNRRFDC
jgi:hypothetical protein